MRYLKTLAAAALAVLVTTGASAFTPARKAKEKTDYSAIHGVCYNGWRSPEEIVRRDLGYGKKIDFNKDYGYAAIKSGSYTLADVMSVLDIEDMKETCFESDRNTNLRRWGIADMNGGLYQRVAARSSKYEKQFAPHKVWMPIPQSEENNNPNLDQIEGY